jgi:hypothetical protein
MATESLTQQIQDLRQRLTAIESAAPSASSTSRRLSFLQNRDLDAMGWSEWDYKGLTFDFIGQEIVIPVGTKFVAFDYYEHPGDAFSNIKLIYREGDATNETPYSGVLYGGEIIDRHYFPEDPTLRVIGTNTRIWYGRAMSDIQFVYTFGPNSEYSGATEWCRPWWPYNEAYSLRCAGGWEVDGIQVAIHNGNAVTAIRIHSRKIA